MPVVESLALSRFTCSVLEARGLSADDAALVGASLQWADERGIASHGVAFLPVYLQMIEAGDIDVHARPQRMHDTPPIVDARQAAGAVGMACAMAEALREVRASGTTTLWVRRLTHAGAMGQYVELAARQGCLAMLFVAGPPLMAYHGAATAAATTGPLAMAVPGPDGEPVVFDMAVSEISFARLRRARVRGEVLPLAAALDADGAVTTDAARAVTPLPMAGAKGSGMALMFELMASLAVANPVVEPHLRAATPADRRHTQNAMILLARVDAFPSGADFVERVRSLRETIEGLPRAQGVERIHLPGDRRRATQQARATQGIAIDPAAWQTLGAIGQAAGVELPPIRP